MIEKYEECPTCRGSDEWVYDLQQCDGCGHGHFKSGVALIGGERLRHIHEEGWTPEHDDTHTDGSMAMAAACFAATEPIFARRDDHEGHSFQFDDPWPESWHEGWDKRNKDDRVDLLVKAGALIAAEIDRLQRKDFKRLGRRDNLRLSTGRRPLGE